LHHAASGDAQDAASGAAALPAAPGKDRNGFSVSAPPTLVARSLIFNALFYVNLFVHMIAALPTLALPHRVHLAFIRSYARTSLWLLRVVCGITVEWRGLAKIPPGGCIVACKHQSAWETFALYAAFDDPAYILKRELMWIPLFGWHMAKAGLIPIDRSGGIAALSRMTARARRELERSRQVVIFPEGTRRPPGAEPDYKPGVAYLYQRAGVPCVPLALDSGLFWPRRSWLRRRGTILAEVLDPIAPGLEARAFLTRLQGVLEDASGRLLRESAARSQALGTSIPRPEA
jgi:1-acyl-sn-glycerol-3-phosphate acyltransferase